MPDRDAFMRAIRERPDDDGPRLVYADWLEEHGDPRGEFIRIQCELAKLPPWHSSRPALEEREADLLTAHDYEWLGRPPNWVIGWEFERGFVARFTAARSTLAGLEGLLAESVQPKVAFAVRHPQQLGGGSMRELWNSPFLEELTGLDWLEPVPNDERESLSTLLMSPRLAGLRRIGVWGEAADGRILADLHRRPGKENLRELEVDSFDAGAADAFFDYRSLNSIKSLAFTRQVSRRLIHRVGSEPYRWHKLDFGMTACSWEEVSGLWDFQRLTELRLHWTLRERTRVPECVRRLHLHAHGLPRLQIHPGIMLQLQWLHVITDSDDPASFEDDWRTFGDFISQLRGPVFHFEISGRSGLLGRLARLPAKDRIRRLAFECDEMTDDDVQAFVEQGDLSRIQGLHLRSSQLTSRHVEMFAAMPLPPSLRRFSLNSPRVDDSRLATMFRSPNLQRLMLINLRECQVGWRTLAALVESPVLSRLRELILPLGGELTEDDIRSFRQTPGLSPLCRVHRR